MKTAEVVKDTGSVGGSVLSVFCPACVPAVGSFLTAIGLGALVNFQLLSYITIAFLLLGLTGLYLNYKKHKLNYFLIIGIIASIGVYSARYISESQPLIYLSAAVLIGNAVFDYFTLRKCRKCKI